MAVSATMTSITAKTPALAAPIACAGCLAAGAAYVAANDPSSGGTFLPCPFRSLTGLWCPGCGMTRATHHLLRGDVTQALRYNAFVIAIIAGIAAGWLAWTLSAVGRSLTGRRTLPAWAPVVGITALIAFAVLRNATSLPLTG